LPESYQIFLSEYNSWHEFAIQSLDGEGGRKWVLAIKPNSARTTGWFPIEGRLG
jgi:hypothetical protein